MEREIANKRRKKGREMYSIKKAKLVVGDHVVVSRDSNHNK